MSSRIKQRVQILKKIVYRINEVVVPGVGAWEPAWIHTMPKHEDLILALDKWVKDDTPDTRNAVRIAADEYVAVWKQATEFYLNREK